VFAEENIEKGTLLWTQKLIKRHSESDCHAILSLMTLENANVWLRQTFVYADHPDFLCSNEDDDGRFVNHSSSPNTGYAISTAPSISLRDIEKGDELTCNYSGLGSPKWYKDLCKIYNVVPTDEIASKN
jgi:SET domain-containing protein